jgi:hypothetical protein
MGAESPKEAADDAGAEVVFQATAAHAFVIGSACFGIFWGVVNALLIRNVKIEDDVIAKTLTKENKSE